MKENNNINGFLLDHEQICRIIEEYSRDHIFIIDDKDIVRFVNKSASGSLGVSEQKIIGQPRKNFFSPAVFEKQSQSLKKVFETGLLQEFESKTEIMGNEVYLNTHLIPVINNCGVVYAVMGISRDITTLVTTREELRQLGEQYISIIENIGVGISIISKNMEIISLNKKMREWFPNIDINQKNICFKVFNNPTGEKACSYCPVIKTFEDGEVHKAVSETPAGDEINYYKIISTPLRDKDGQIIAAIEMVDDITSVVKAEQEAKRKNAILGGINRVFRESLVCETEEELSKKFLSIAEELTESSFGFVGEVNNKDLLDTIAISGTPWNECKNSEIKSIKNIRDLVISGYWGRVIKDSAPLITNSPSSHPESIDVLPDGYPKITSFIGVPFKEEGKTFGMVALANKKAGYNHLDLEILQNLSVAFVETLKRKKTVNDLKRHAVELKRANMDLDAYSYTIAHDLKEPLRGIETFSNLLLEDYADRLDDEGKHYVLRISAGVSRAGSLITDLLNVARVSREKNPFIEASSKKLIQDAVKRLGVLIDEKNAQIEIKGELPDIYCDPIKLKEVFYNLISNAIKYNNSHNIKVEIGIFTKDGELIFFVKDNGIGIKKEYFELIFLIFKRLHPRDKYKGGTGAGLAIVKKIIEDHHGRIWVESKEGEGTTFYFTIPQKADDL